MSQGSLFSDPEAFHSKVILRRKDFDALFEGFVKLRAVSYVVSPDLLLEFLDRRGYQELEIVVGENLTESYRQDLARKGVEVTQRLAQRIADGRLKIFVPDKTQHTKLYLLERPGLCRAIATSANLTETARQAARQINYAWYADLPPGHPWLAQVEKDYGAHRELCSLFMGDLAELLRKSGEEKKRELVEVWLKAVPAEEVDIETRKLFQEISMRAVQPQPGTAEAVFTVRLPEAPAARREAERFLSPLNALETSGELRLDGPGYLRYVQATQGVPVMQVDLEQRRMLLGLDGATLVVTEPLPEAAVVAAALEHIETYLQTVDAGQAPDPKFAKTSMFEALLYILSSPFANEYMRLKRRRYGAIDSRGPRFLPALRAQAARRPRLRAAQWGGLRQKENPRRRLHRDGFSLGIRRPGSHSALRTLRGGSQVLLGDLVERGRIAAADHSFLQLLQSKGLGQVARQTARLRRPIRLRRLRQGNFGAPVQNGKSPLPLVFSFVFSASGAVRGTPGRRARTRAPHLRGALPTCRPRPTRLFPKRAH